MGVITTADEIRYTISSQVENLDLGQLESLKQDLEKMIDKETWGGRDWNKTFIEETKRGIKKINKFKKDLQRLKTEVGTW